MSECAPQNDKDFGIRLLDAVLCATQNQSSLFDAVSAPDQYRLVQARFAFGPISSDSLPGQLALATNLSQVRLVLCFPGSIYCPAQLVNLPTGKAWFCLTGSRAGPLIMPVGAGTKEPDSAGDAWLPDGSPSNDGPRPELCRSTSERSPTGWMWCHAFATGNYAQSFKKT